MGRLLTATSASTNAPGHTILALAISRSSRFSFLIDMFKKFHIDADIFTNVHINIDNKHCQRHKTTQHKVNLELMLVVPPCGSNGVFNLNFQVAPSGG